ncbi:MAG: RecX family transcriptional regulator [Muribaculum sp.]|nr:RecX family transcriptional regulator [Muribaculum sp.]
MIKRQMSAEMALERLEAQCAMSEYCTHEIREKLFKWGVDANVREQIVEKLVENRFVDDRRYARAYVRDKAVYGKWGRRKIALGLASKRIERDIADEALEEIDEERYYDNLCAILSSKLRTVKAETDYELKSKLYRRGLQCGYESAVVSRAVKDLLRH